MRAKYLECGKIINTHGTDGAIKLDSWCDSPEVLAGLKRIYLEKGGEYTPLKIKRASVFKSFVIAKVEGVNTIDDAMALRERIVYADRDDIPKGDGHFIADLIGLDVIDVDDGKVYGKLREVINRGASDIYVVDTPDGDRMMPAVSEFVKEIDLDKGIFVKPIEGMF